MCVRNWKIQNYTLIRFTNITLVLCAVIAPLPQDLGVTLDCEILISWDTQSLCTTTYMASAAAGKYVLDLF